MMTFIKRIMFAGIILSLCGCTILLWGANKTTSENIEYKKVSDDDVEGFFKYNNLRASVVDGEISYPVDIPSEGVAFYGKKSIYVITRMDSGLLELDALNGQVPLTLEGDSNTIQLNITLSASKVNAARFTSSLHVIANLNGREPSTEEARLLKRTGFHLDSEKYVNKTNFSGVILPIKALNLNPAKQGNLKVKYKIELWSKVYNTRIHPSNIITNAVITPVAVAADIVFFPVSLTFLRFMIGVGAFDN